MTGNKQGQEPLIVELSAKAYRDGARPDQPPLHLLENAWRGILAEQAETERREPLAPGEFLEEGTLLGSMRKLYAVKQADKRPPSRLSPGTADLGLVSRAAGIRFGPRATPHPRNRENQ